MGRGSRRRETPGRLGIVAWLELDQLFQTRPRYEEIHLLIICRGGVVRTTGKAFSQLQARANRVLPFVGSSYIDGNSVNVTTSGNFARDNDEAKFIIRYTRRFILASFTRFRAVLG